MSKKSDPEIHGKAIRRRDFLKSASLATAAALTAPAVFSPVSIITRKAAAQYSNTDQIKVIVSRDDGCASGSQIITDYVQVTLDEAIRRLTNIYDVGEAYKSVFPRITSQSVIGIKVNCINSDLPTHPEVVDALIRGLVQMNVDGAPFPENNIIIWDRSNADLQAAGFTINTGTEGVRCFGTDQVGFNTSISLNCAGVVQHPSRILTDYIDYHVDFAVLKNASGSGVTLTMKNNYGCINEPWNLHSNGCDPGIPAVNQQIRDELDVIEALFIVDAIFGVTAGGPMGPPNLQYNGILMGFDRVAVDTIGSSILEEFGCTTLGNATHLETAAEPPYNLGTNDLDEIHRLDITNPSVPVTDLRVVTQDRDVMLTWSSPEFTGYFKVLRSPDPYFSQVEEIAVVQGGQYLDRQAIGPMQKNFYRVMKTW